MLRTPSKAAAMTDRITIDLKGLRQRIQGFRADSAWKKMSLGAKVRFLVEVALGLVEHRQDTIATVLKLHWAQLLESNVDLTLKRLQEIKAGKYPNDFELIELSRSLPAEYDVRRLTEIRNREFNGADSHEPNDPRSSSPDCRMRH
jgi:hypothetical protein